MAPQITDHTASTLPVVLQMLEALRADCESPVGGCKVMEAVGLCASHGLQMPEWLSASFIRMRSRVVEGHVASWDEAIGRVWPARTRIAAARRRLVLRKRVHAAVWELVARDPTRGIGRILFEEVGERVDINTSGSMAERLYYEAVSAGCLNVAQWRRAQQAECRPSHGNDAIPGTAT